MKIHIGSDHAGLEFKAKIIEHLKKSGHTVTDHGPHTFDALDDYPIFCIPTAIATDWQPYADWIKPRFDANPKFTGGIVPRPNWRPISKFEGQGLKKGHLVTDFRYEKL